jgi:hypothetical protein
VSKPRRRSPAAPEIDTTIPALSCSGGVQGTPYDQDERQARQRASRPGRGRHARPRSGPATSRTSRLLLYLAGGVVILGAALALGPWVRHVTSSSPPPAPRTPLPAGSSQLVPGENPVAQAVGGGVATPVTAPSPPVSRPTRTAQQRTR